MNKKEQFFPLSNLINAISKNSAAQGGISQISTKPQDKLSIQRIFVQRGLHRKKRSDELSKDNHDTGTQKLTNSSQGRRLTDSYGRQLPSHAYSFSMKGIGTSHRKDDSLPNFDWEGQHMNSQIQNSSQQQTSNDDLQQHFVQDNSGKKSSYSYLDSQIPSKVSSRSNHAMMTSSNELNASQYKVRQAYLSSGEIIRSKSVLNENNRREHFHRQTEMVREKGQNILRSSSLVKHSEKILKILPIQQKNTLEGQLIRMEDSYNNNDSSFQTNKLSDRNLKNFQHFLSTDACDQSNNLANQFFNDSPLKYTESQEDKVSTKELFSKDAMDFMLIEMMSKIDETIMSRILQGEEQFGVKHWKRMSEILNAYVPLILRKVEDLFGMKSTICSFLVFLGNFFTWFLNLSIDHIEKRVASAEFKVRRLFEDKLKSVEKQNQELLASYKKESAINQQLIEEHAKSEDGLRKQLKKLETQIFLLKEELSEDKTSGNIHESCEQMTEKISDLQIFIERLQRDNTLSGYTMEDGFNCLAGSLIPRNKPMVDFIDSVKGELHLKQSSDSTTVGVLSDHPFLIAFSYNFLSAQFWNNSEELDLNDSDMKKGMEEFLNKLEQADEIQEKTVAEAYLEFVLEKHAQNERKAFREIEETVRFLGRSKANNCVGSFFCQLFGIKGFIMPGSQSICRVIALNSGVDLKGIALEDRIETQAAIMSLRNILPLVSNEIMEQFQMKFERFKSIQKVQILSFILSAVEQECENEKLIKVGLRADELAVNPTASQENHFTYQSVKILAQNLNVKPHFLFSMIIQRLQQTIPRTRNSSEDSQLNRIIAGCSQEELSLKIFNQTKTSMSQLIGECMLKVLNFQQLLSNQLNAVRKAKNTPSEGQKLEEQLANNQQDQQSPDNSIRKQRFTKRLRKLKTQLKIFENLPKKIDN